MDKKKIVATLYLKDGVAVKGANDFTPVGDVHTLAQHYNDSGIDKLICYDLSNDDAEHEANLSVLKEINRTLAITCCGGGNVKRLEDVKKLLYAGCKQVIINGSKPGAVDLCKEAGARFGVEKIVVSLTSLDFIFKTSGESEPILLEYLLMNSDLLQGMNDATNMPYIVETSESDTDKLFEILNLENIKGISGSYFNDPDTDIMDLKCRLAERGIRLDNFEPAISWKELKVGENGLVPVVVQDYKTNEVLMLAYMNEEAFYTTLRLGRMTYWSRSRGELWVKGETSGHYQYVKSLDCDCDKDTILAKVSQIGAACHTGAKSCFFNEIVKKPYIEKNPLNVLVDTYNVIADRKVNPKEGSYTNYLFDKGLDKILKKVGEEATEMVIAAKNPGAEELEYELSDFLYHAMVLMVEKGLTWEDVVAELARR